MSAIVGTVEKTLRLDFSFNDVFYSRDNELLVFYRPGFIRKLTIIDLSKAKETRRDLRLFPVCELQDKKAAIAISPFSKTIGVLQSCRCNHFHDAFIITPKEIFSIELAIPNTRIPIGLGFCADEKYLCIVFEEQSQSVFYFVDCETGHITKTFSTDLVEKVRFSKNMIYALARKETSSKVYVINTISWNISFKEFEDKLTDINICNDEYVGLFGYRSELDFYDQNFVRCCQLKSKLYDGAAVASLNSKASMLATIHRSGLPVLWLCQNASFSDYQLMEVFVRPSIMSFDSKDRLLVVTSQLVTVLRLDFLSFSDISESENSRQIVL